MISLKTIFKDLQNYLKKYNIDLSENINNDIWIYIDNLFIESWKITIRKFNDLEIMIKMMRGKKVKNLNNTNQIHGDLFLEVESMLAYFLINFNDNPKLYFQFMEQYHKDKILFLYLFSIFDIVATLICYHYNFQNEYDKIYFKKIDSYIDKENNKDLFEFINKFIKTNIFKYLNKKRNEFTHQLSHPMFGYSFVNETKILFITIMYFLDKVSELLK